VMPSSKSVNDAKALNEKATTQINETDKWIRTQRRHPAKLAASCAVRVVRQQHIKARTADFADRILPGAKPADIAVERPTKIDLVLD
jgi:hypothetical protein